MCFISNVCECVVCDVLCDVGCFCVGVSACVLMRFVIDLLCDVSWLAFVLCSCG